jgi:hypothetical protein
MEFDDHYQFLVRFFSIDTIVERFKLFYDKTCYCLRTLEVEEKARISRESFSNFILDYFTDVLRAKQFHNIDRVNVNKIYGYEMYWFLRRKPVQILEEIPGQFDINEKVALMLFLPQIYKEAGINHTKIPDKEAENDIINLLFYNMKYRIFTQQSFELMISAFLTGVKCKTEASPK